MSISIQNLTKLYHTQKAVNDISFEVKKGEIVGFLGPNGAGKTTTIKMLMNLIKPSGGTVSIFNQEIKFNDFKFKFSTAYL